MYPELRITLDEHMDMIGHHFQAHYFCLMLLTHFLNDTRQALCYPLNEYLASILRTKNNVILARVIDVPIRFVASFTHENSIQLEVIYCQTPTLPHLPRRLKRNAAYIPRAKATGFYAAI